ncbi:DUF1467 family protein, partial [Streptomyces galilaeus]|uniref:DUF1467 family protein n=1 Tax=Streptomyces galilaeus TaxID=33899 RepID=UPI0038F7058F
FLVLPFGVRTHAELGLDAVPGQALSAPGNFRPRVIVRRATMLAIVLFGLYYLNYVEHWITIDDIDISRWIGLA